MGVPAFYRWLSQKWAQLWIFGMNVFLRHVSPRVCLNWNTERVTFSAQLQASLPSLIMPQVSKDRQGCGWGVKRGSQWCRDSSQHCAAEPEWDWVRQLVPGEQLPSVPPQHVRRFVSQAHPFAFHYSTIRHIAIIDRMIERPQGFWWWLLNFSELMS